MTTSPLIVRTIDVTARPSERLLRACAAFGLAVRHAPNRVDAGRPRRTADAQAILHALRPGQVALITGPSGGGKSSLLRDIGRARAGGDHLVILPESPGEAGTPIIDLLRLPLAESLSTLARAGLADAMLLGRSAAQVSEGERFRLRLALAMSACRGTRPFTLIIDEFASTLDRTTARGLCAVLRRWLGSQGGEGRHVRIIAATAHHDVADWLDPHLIAVVPLGDAPVQFTRLPGVRTGHKTLSDAGAPRRVRRDRARVLSPKELDHA